MASQQNTPVYIMFVKQKESISDQPVDFPSFPIQLFKVFSSFSNWQSGHLWWKD